MVNLLLAQNAVDYVVEDGKELRWGLRFVAILYTILGHPLGEVESRFALHLSEPLDYEEV